jgi:hypothetical protein
MAQLKASEDPLRTIDKAIVEIDGLAAQAKRGDGTATLVTKKWRNLYCACVATTPGLKSPKKVQSLSCVEARELVIRWFASQAEA